jgi:hypothetical protein
VSGVAAAEEVVSAGAGVDRERPVASRAGGEDTPIGDGREAAEAIARAVRA